MNYRLLPNINSTQDLKGLSTHQLVVLAQELRDFIIHAVAAKEGHLGASLGVVELTLALHTVLSTPDDVLIWDVGHQAYPHKILTGRRDQFDTNRQWGGISGFPKRDESEYDAFGTGHSSTAISAALGMALASKLSGNQHRQHVAVVGDASIVSGMAFEAMNHAGVSDTNLLIILNDNSIGIDPSVGGLKNTFAKARCGDGMGASSFFEAFGLKYTGPVCGHDLQALCDQLADLTLESGPKLLHVVTTKGKGLAAAERDQVGYHAPGKFEARTGRLVPRTSDPQPPKFQDVFGETLLELAHDNERIVGITPAMPTGSSLKMMMDVYPERALDVGISEQHAVTLAAGLAAQGYVPFCTIYSTFLQRAYDQVIHDVALQQLPVVLCIDRAGLVGADGPTHHGVFDIAYLRSVPNITIAAPRNAMIMRNLLYTASLGLDGPLAIRYPRGRCRTLQWRGTFSEVELGRGQQLKAGSRVAVLSVGTMANQVTEALALLKEDTKFYDEIGHYDMGFVKPLDSELLEVICSRYSIIITVEDGVLAGGFGSGVLEWVSQYSWSGELRRLGIEDDFISHGTTSRLYEYCGLSSQKIASYLVGIQ